MHNNWFNALKTLYVLFFIFLINTKCTALDDESRNEKADIGSEVYQIQEPEEGEMAKRAWNQLQATWGKRAFNLKEGNTPLNNDDYMDALRNLDYDVSRIHDNYLMSDSRELEVPQTVEKRAWNSMNSAWGKRNWSKYRGTGKREPGNWNNLRGLWGKRSRDTRSWNKLSQAWGK